VTVLFADVVRSMDMAASLDIERLHEIMTELVDRSAAVVQRYGGTVDKFTGDGIMALFGAPIALEDHAVRACLAALEIQQEAHRLAAEVERRDGIEFRLRVGLNSGRVIAGEIGSGSWGYTAVGEQVGLAQRMESVATPGGVMLSESSSRLVEHAAVLSEPELVHIKGFHAPVPARALLGMRPGQGMVARQEAGLVGRHWEMAALDALVDRTIGGRGGVVNVAGPPGIGKSRVAREAAAIAAARGADVHWTYCESHASDIPFRVVAELLRTGAGVGDLDGDAARAGVRELVPDAVADDLLLLDDLLGIADPDVPLPQIDPDARRRKLTALVNSVTLARTEPTLFIIEDAHWIDAVSESMLADFLTVIPHTPAMVLITYRPEYQGALTRAHGTQTIALAPLGDSDTAALLQAFLGSDPSVSDLMTIIAERAAGNPFFAEEIVRELVQRGVLAGEHGGYVCRTDTAEFTVPATVQAAIEARIDRLSAPAKRTLNAASVIGAHFSAELLVALDIQPAVDELLSVELIDQVRFTPHAEYAFHHPLIRAVAYESQLKSDRAEWHRQLAESIESSNRESADQNAALIAEHLESAGELHAAYDWHMRAGAWSINRDVGAARVSWERACRIADRLPDDDPGRLSMRIAPRTMLCATGWQAFQETQGRFEELRELCAAAGDKVSLAIGMTGLETELVFAGRSPEGARLASEQMALLESIGDAALTVGSTFIPFNNWFDAGEFGEILRWSQTVIELTKGDPAMGADFGFGSPLAAALAWRGVALFVLGQAGWRQHLHDAVTMARNSDPTTLAMVTGWTYGIPIGFGVLRADDAAIHTIAQAVQTAEASSHAAVSIAKYALAVGLLHRDAAADRDRGLELIVQVRDTWLTEPIPFLVPVGELWIARERARRGNRDSAIPAMRNAVEDLYRAGRPFFALLGSGLLVEALLERGADGDVAEAEEAIDRLADLRPDDSWAMRDITALRMRTLLARDLKDEVAYRDLMIRYRTMAESLGFDGHIAWAKAMADAFPRND
jgi:class 3 adenylate cyclase/tetratricopeptide (TPR) repeat protein